MSTLSATTTTKLISVFELQILRENVNRNKPGAREQAIALFNDISQYNGHRRQEIKRIQQDMARDAGAQAKLKTSTSQQGYQTAPPEQPPMQAASEGSIKSELNKLKQLVDTSDFENPTNVSKVEEQITVLMGKISQASFASRKKDEQQRLNSQFDSLSKIERDFKARLDITKQTAEFGYCADG